MVYRHSGRGHETADFLQLAAISSGAVSIQHWNREWNWMGEPPPLSQLRVQDLLRIQEVCHTDVFSDAYAADVQADTIVSTDAFAWSNALHTAATCGRWINPIWVGPKRNLLDTGAPGQKSVPPFLPLRDAAEGAPHRWSHWDWKGLQPLNSSPIYDVVPRSRRAETGRIRKDSDLKEGPPDSRYVLLFPVLVLGFPLTYLPKRVTPRLGSLSGMLSGIDPVPEDLQTRVPWGRR